MGPDLLYILEPEQHTATTDWMQKQVKESSCLLLSQTLNRFTKLKKQLHSSDFFGVEWEIIIFH